MAQRSVPEGGPSTANSKLDFIRLELMDSIAGGNDGNHAYFWPDKDLYDAIRAAYRNPAMANLIEEAWRRFDFMRVHHGQSPEDIVQ